MDYRLFFPIFEVYYTRVTTLVVHMVTLVVATMFVQRLVTSRTAPALYGGFLVATNTQPRVAIISALFMLYYMKYHMAVSCTTMVTTIAAQYFSHIIGQEDSLLQSYVHTDQFVSMFVTHVLYTIPCLLQLFFIRVLFPSKDVLIDAIEPGSLHARYIAKWVRHTIGSESEHVHHYTYHWWYDGAPDDVRHHFAWLNSMVLARIKYATPMMYAIDSIAEMNEIYVSSSRQRTNNSDNVFYSENIDGPFYLFPFCSVKRVILAVNKNEHITTVFPRQELRTMLTDGDFVSFDFNRDIHYIVSTEVVPEEPRITLKLHYLVYPRGMRWFANLLRRMNAAYDRRARKLFLYTLAPETLPQRLVTKVVNWTTWATYWAEEHVGLHNVLLLGLVLL